VADKKLTDAYKELGMDSGYIVNDFLSSLGVKTVKIGKTVLTVNKPRINRKTKGG
jgi:hypothetical protein